MHWVNVVQQKKRFTPQLACQRVHSVVMRTIHLFTNAGHGIAQRSNTSISKSKRWWTDEEGQLCCRQESRDFLFPRELGFLDVVAAVKVRRMRFTPPTRPRYAIMFSFTSSVWHHFSENLCRFFYLAKWQEDVKSDLKMVLPTKDNCIGCEIWLCVFFHLLLNLKRN